MLMTIALADRIQETTSTTGTGTLSLNGHSTGYQSFSVLGSGSTTYYCVVSGNGTDWEVGSGTFTSGSPNTLSRSSILASSTGSTISLVGLSTVFCVAPASQLQYVMNTAGMWNPVVSLYDRKPDAGEVLCDITLGFGVSLPASLTGSAGGINTSLNGSAAATSTAVFTLYKNGASIGTATIPSGTTGRGIATFSFTSQITFAAGDSFVVQAPSSQDATLQGFSFSFLGTRT